MPGLYDGLELTERDYIVFGQIASKKQQIEKETTLTPTHVLMHPEELSRPLDHLMGMIVIRSRCIERGKVYLTYQT